jgi:hypothetical protein
VERGEVVELIEVRISEGRGEGEGRERGGRGEGEGRERD